MKRTILALAAFPSEHAPRLRVAVIVSIGILAPLLCQAEDLLTPVAMAGSGQYRIYVAYADGTVWSAPDTSSALVEVVEANRHMPVRAMYPCVAYVLTLYADNQVWALFRPGIDPPEFVADLTRPDAPEAKAIRLTYYQYYNVVLTAVYEDGQVWQWVAGVGLHRLRQWERPSATSGVEQEPGTIESPSSEDLRPSDRISFRLSAPSSVAIRVFDVGGHLVRRLGQDLYPAGEHSFVWDGRDDAGKAAPRGVYFTRVETPDGVATAKITLAR